jgi:hypothetical protein
MEATTSSRASFSFTRLRRMSLRLSAMASSYLFVAWLALLGWPAEPGR